MAHVDAMRPVKQAGVVSTHALLMFAPAGTAVTVGASLMLLHVTREAFLFVSACMLTYSCRNLRIANWREFYRRRLTLVAVPYVAWTLIYGIFTWHRVSGPFSDHLEHLGYLFATGYYQLYYLVVLLQFYALFPLALALVRRVQHHERLLLASLGLQALYVSLMHWDLLPPALRDDFWASREVTSYQFYLLVGMVSAIHLDAVHNWLAARVQAIAVFTIATAAIAEGWYFLATDHFSWLGSNSDPFQPIVIPFNIGMIALIYVFGMWLADPKRPRALRRSVQSGSDNAYSVFLAQMVFLTMLTWFGWQRLSSVVPWPLVCIVGVAVVFALCVGFSEVAARTPLSRGLTGRARIPFPRRRQATIAEAPVTSDDADLSAPLAHSVPA